MRFNTKILVKLDGIEDILIGYDFKEKTKVKMLLKEIRKILIKEEMKELEGWNNEND